MGENQVKIPKGWIKVKFKDFVYFQEGPGLTSSLFKEAGFPFLNIRCIENGAINISSCQFISEEIANTIYKHFQLDENDLVVSTSGTLGKKAFVRKDDLPLMLNTSIIRFKPLNENDISLNFLNYLLEDYDFLYDLYSQSTGSAQVNVGPSHLKKLSISIPKSITEQTQIAAILSKVDEAIIQTEQLISKYSRIKTGLMQDLLAKGIDENGNIRSEETHEFKDSPLGRIPKEWKCEQIEGNKEFVTSGSRGWAKYYAEEGSQFIRITNLKRNQIEIDRSDLKYVKLPVSVEGIRSKLEEGDLLISITADLGIIGVVPQNFGDAFVNQHIALVRLNREKVHPIYIGYLLSSQIGQSMFNLLNDGGAKAGLNLNIINQLNILKPKLPEQILIVEKIEKGNKLIIELKANLLKLQSLKTGIMQDLLSGKVRVNQLIKETTTV